MARSLWDVFLSLIRREDKGDDDRDGFVPSPLDLSVRHAHGGPDSEIDRELHRMEQQAEELEENQHRE
jgi:hypothetical protein